METALLNEAIWYVIGETLIYLSAGLFSTYFVYSILVLLIGFGKPDIFQILGTRGVMSNLPKYGQQ